MLEEEERNQEQRCVERQGQRDALKSVRHWLVGEQLTVAAEEAFTEPCGSQERTLCSCKGV